MPSTGDQIEVFWPLDNTYYSGEITAVNGEGKCVITHNHDV